MDKIEWCFEKDKGIEIVETNSNLSKAYIKKAEESLETLHQIENKDWKISTAYYTMYFSLYSIFMKIGVKCEIHSCSIEFMKVFLKDYFDKSDYMLLKNSFNARIDAQYYADREVSKEIYNKTIKNTPRFLVKCKSVLEKLDQKSIQKIRNNLKNY